MRKTAIALVLAFVFGLPALLPAQVVPRVTLFGGYTFVRSQQNSGSGIAGSNFNLNGWDASLEGGFAPWLGIVTDVSQQYGSPFGYQEKQTTVLFGPQINIHGIHKIMPFAHVLAGVVHGTNRFTQLVPPCSPSSCPGTIATGYAFATAVGGGVDIKVFGPLWIRAVQADWLHANLNPDHHTQFRLSAGIALHFGGL